MADNKPPFWGKTIVQMMREAREALELIEKLRHLNQKSVYDGVAFKKEFGGTIHGSDTVKVRYPHT